MKKQLFSFLLSCLVCCCVTAVFPQSAYAQVEFSKFKLSKDEPFGAFPGRKMLNTKFKVTADRDLKYILVDYYIVNAVGDVISGYTQAIKNDTTEFIKPKRMECTGPFSAGKSYSPWVSGVITNPSKDLIGSQSLSLKITSPPISPPSNGLNIVERIRKSYKVIVPSRSRLGFFFPTSIPSTPFSLTHYTIFL